MLSFVVRHVRKGTKAKVAVLKFLLVFPFALDMKLNYRILAWMTFAFCSITMITFDLYNCVL